MFERRAVEAAIWGMPAVSVDAMRQAYFRDGKASASEVMERMSDPPSYSAVRATLRVLEQKGLLRHEDDGTRYLYKPAVSRERAKHVPVRLVHVSSLAVAAL